jgi:hypothetical protein
MAQGDKALYINKYVSFPLPDGKGIGACFRGEGFVLVLRFANRERFNKFIVELRELEDSGAYRVSDIWENAFREEDNREPA